MGNWAVAEVGGWVFLPPLLFAVLLPIEAKTGLYLILPVWAVLYVFLFKRVWRRVEGQVLKLQIPSWGRLTP